MTGSDPNKALRGLVRELLGELMPSMLSGTPDRPRVNGHANGTRHEALEVPAPPVTEVPAPPVAAVLRPSTWSSPAAPGEVIGDRPSAQAMAVGGASDARVEPVTIDTDEDLERFVHALLARVDNPRDRQAIRAGRLRFSLRRSAVSAVAAGAAPPGSQLATARVVKGAVTERAVRAAAAEGARLVLSRGAVLTPLARDCARALGVEIERERRC